MLFEGIEPEDTFHVDKVLIRIVAIGEPNQCLDFLKECHICVLYMSILNGVAKHWLNY